MSSITGFILAGGQSRRMGTDKALLRWQDGTLLDHMMRKLGAITNTVRVVGRGDLPDRHPGQGPVEGIATALGTTETTNNLIVAVDLPYIEEAFLKFLADRLHASRSGAVICDITPQMPLCLGLSRNLLEAVDQYLDSGGRSVRGLIESVAHETVTECQLTEGGFSPEMFRNLNTPDDYHQTRPGETS
jgi:molybdopterin-guanine dinucleotide biosynthesis protein A